MKHLFTNDIYKYTEKKKDIIKILYLAKQDLHNLRNNHTMLKRFKKKGYATP